MIFVCYSARRPAPEIADVFVETVYMIPQPGGFVTTRNLKTGLRQRIGLVQADREELNQMAVEHHYMHRPVHQRSCPFGWQVNFDGALTRTDGAPCGFIIFASIHYTRLRGEFGYPGLPTKWQVLSLARLWLHDDLPRNSETVVIAKAIKLVQARWLEVHPPRYAGPYHIRKIISYADTRHHRGTIYRAANFREVGRTVSQARHHNSRGPGQESELICFVYDLPEPRWSYAGALQMPLVLGNLCPTS
jgi:hypothetical protein